MLIICLSQSSKLRAINADVNCYVKATVGRRFFLLTMKGKKHSLVSGGKYTLKHNGLYSLKLCRNE